MGMERVLLLIAVLATVSSIVISNEQANASEICYGGSSISWTGNGGDDLWSNTQNWNPQRLPASNDVICIHGGPFTVDRKSVV